MRQVIAPVVSRREVMSNCHLLWLEAPGIAAEARPGQFVMARCGGDTLLRRPLSIHQRAGDKIALLFQVVGKGTDWLSRLQAGDSVDLLGPLGNGFSIQPTAKHLLLVAGGIGIAPLVFLSQEASRQGYSMRIVLGARTASQLYADHMPPLAATLIFATDDGSRGEKGLATEIAPSHALWADQIFACGPVPMYRHLAEHFPLAKQPVQISLEIMMGCGVGVCYGCTVRTRNGLRQVCQDGPVFDLKDILWDVSQ